VASYIKWYGDKGVTLHDMQSVAMEVSGAIEPGFVVQSGHVNDQRVALQVPMDQPIQESAGGLGLRSMKTMRVALANS